ncbi:LegC family aminotransferase [Ectothiorhodospira sp. BSL-9]|uniref:LegC family aminotransferase n=1 Tax=Ectothiorhodospira sp. BSL-9 TaxID=1442136 RepID=UPI0009EF1876|nr:LegC family aminotransferase [Ectothiorhodospira sp. BSL-9]
MPTGQDDFAAVVATVRSMYGEGFIPLHRPVFEGHERQYLVECIDSNFVSSVGARVTEFEERVAAFTGARFAVATVNGTAALHMALHVAGVGPGDEVITQALTFVATCNAIRYGGAQPVFVDVDQDTLGMGPQALRRFLETHARRRGGECYNRVTGRRLAACVPMHTFGHPCRIREIVALCDEYGIAVVEDAAESLGSWVGERHTGTFGRLGTLSFNGNKVITTGGGGMIITDDEALAHRARHVTTTAKQPHAYEYVHDEVGYNYRLPNLNAALGCAQMERLPEMLAAKREVARGYAAFCEGRDWHFVNEPEGARSNFWFNAFVLGSMDERDAFLEYTNAQGVMTRPAWRLMHRLEMFKDCQHDGLEHARWLEERLVNLPSSVPDGALPPVDTHTS